MSKKKKKNHKSPANEVKAQLKDAVKDDAALKEEAEKTESGNEEDGKAGKTDIEETAPVKEETADKPLLSDTVPIPQVMTEITGDMTEIAPPELPAEEKGPDTGSILEEAVNEARERLSHMDEAAEGQPAAESAHLYPQEEPLFIPETVEPEQDGLFTQEGLYTPEEQPVKHYIPESVTKLLYEPEDVAAEDTAAEFPEAVEPEMRGSAPAAEKRGHDRVIAAKKAELLSELASEIAEPEDVADLELIELPEIEKEPVAEEAVKPAPKPAKKKKSKAKAKTKDKPAKSVRTQSEQKEQTVKIKRRKGTSWFEKNQRFCLAAIALLLVGIAILIFVSGMLQKDKGSDPEESVSVDVVLSSSENGESAVLIPTDPLVENTDEELKTLVSSYFKARQENDIDAYSALRSYTDSLEKAKLEAKSEYIEAYRNIKIYTKPGPYDDSLMVYVSYDLKLKEFEQTVPALETLVVCREKAEGAGSGDDNSNSENEAPKGKLYVYSGGFDENVVEYIKAITAQEDVVDLFKHVDTAYQEIMDSDPEYEEYMASLKQLIRDGVGERLAAEAEAEDATPTPAPEEGEDGEEGGEGDGEDGEEGGGDADEDKSFLVEATTAVNVRASDSENADRVGNVNPGTQLTCLEQLANGWSKVIYEGKEAFIKSDYVRVIQTEADVKVQGKVTVKESVNIRADANTTSAILGTAYSGTTYDYVEKRDDGWTSILYNGKVAFIKSDYLK